MRSKPYIFFVSFVLSVVCEAAGSFDHPRLLIKDSEKSDILTKIQQVSWAEDIYQTMKSEIDPYVLRHVSDSTWILSRYQMNWADGRHYTDFISDSEGTVIIQRYGNAPVPTVAVGMHKRPPIAPDGYTFKVPEIEDLIPFDTSRVIRMQTSGPSGKWYWAEPQLWTVSINGRINRLALEAAIFYWLAGDEKYAKFTADILMQWACGIHWQHPIRGSLRNGCLSEQTLEESDYVDLVYAYDFIYPYLKRKGCNTDLVERGFAKLADSAVMHGYVNNNWMALETIRLVPCALIQSDPEKRDAYMRFYLSKDTIIQQNYGQKCLGSMIADFLNDQGFWKEAPNYHNHPVHDLIISAYIAEENGYPVFQDHPLLFKAAYVLTDFLFPNGKAMAYGDCHSRTTPSAQSLELALLMADKYKLPIALRLRYELNRLIREGTYSRKRSGYFGLLTYNQDLTSGPEEAANLPRTNALDYAKCFMQRNDTDETYGLMTYVQGATYNHNHANGIAMELYGCGFVLGADPGADASYDTDIHGEYYVQWAAHNTVVADGRSQAVNAYSAGQKDMGEIALVAMEPAPRQPALSPECSFTDVDYLDRSTDTHQQRLLGIIRTSPTTGYYVDIFRSDNPVKNEYIYHNISHELILFDKDLNPLILQPTDELNEDFQKKGPGYKYFKDKMISEPYPKDVIALFRLKTDENDVYMQAWIGPQEERLYFKVNAPRTHTAPRNFTHLPTPTLIIRQPGEAWNRPFIVVYEPYEQVSSIRSLDMLSSTGDFIAFAVQSSALNRTDIILNNTLNQPASIEDIHFQGTYGVITEISDIIRSLYLGCGQSIGKGQFLIESLDGQNIDASVIFQKNKTVYASSCPIKLTMPCSKNNLYLTIHKKKSKIQNAEWTVKKSDSNRRLVSIILPAVDLGEAGVIE